MIPHFILSQFDEKNYEGTIEALTMFVDISGFTSMTQKLMENGKEGVEILTDAMNFIFTPAIKKIRENGGFVSSFAGDAFTAIFPMNTNEILKTLNTAIKINKHFANKSDFATKFGEFSLKVKIGLSYGNVHWQIIQTKNINSYIFEGRAIYNATEAEKKSSVNQIIIDEIIFLKVKNDISYKEKSKGFYLLTEINKKVSDEKVKMIKTNHTSEKYFVPSAVLKSISIGEFRKVVSCFISIEKNEHFIENLKIIMNLSHNYKGYFNKINFGDKGYVALVIFGAPVMPDKVFSMAAEFAIAVSKIKNLNAQIGMSFGVTFSGFIGSDLQKEYTSIGMAVNRAARLMTKAKSKEILIDEELEKNMIQNFEIQFAGNYKLKGFENEILTYKLLKKKKNVVKKTKGQFIGRKDELKQLNQIYKNAIVSSQGKAVFLSGQTGVGKSALIEQFRNMQTDPLFSYRILSCDPLIKKSFNPITTDLNNFFNIHDDKSQSDNLIEFNLRFDNLLSNVEKEDANDLKFRKNYLELFLDFKSISEFNEIDAKLIHKNIVMALVTFYEIMVKNHHFMFQIEESDFMDEDSMEFFKYLSYSLTGNTFMMVFVSKNADFDIDLDFDKHKINITPFDKNHTYLMSLEIIKESSPDIKNIPKPTFEFIWDKSEGLPLFIEQIVNYLIKNTLLDNSYYLTKKAIEIPTDISLLIISKIDKFEPELKRIAKVASVMGKQFTNKLLSHIVKNQNIEKFISEGEEEDIWESLSKLDYIFKSSVIRDSVYDLILKKELYKLHKKVADSILHLYKTKLENYYPDLAHNYLLAELTDKAKFYLKKAVDYSMNLFELSSAKKYLLQLLNIIPHNDLEKADIILQIISIDISQAKPKEAEKYFDLLKNIELKSQQKDKYYILKAQYFVMKQSYKELNDYINKNISSVISKKTKNSLYIYNLDALRALNLDDDFMELAEKLLQSVDKNNALYGKLVNNLGVYYVEKANYDKAKLYFKEFKNISKKNNDKIGMMKALHNLGIIFSRMGDRKKAKEYYTLALDISIQIGDENNKSKLLSDIATIYSINNDVEKAIELYERALKITKALGNKFQEELILYNIGEAYYRLNEFEKALQYLGKSIIVCNKISDITGITFANDLKGDILFSQEKFDEAYDVYISNLTLQKKLSDSEGIAHTFGNLGNLYKIKKEYDKAIEYYQKQLNILQEVGDIEGQGKACFNWAMVETEKNNPIQAKEKLLKALELFEKCSFKYGFKLAKEQLDKIKKL